MGVQPDPGKPLGRDSPVGHLVEQVRHGVIVEPDRYRSRPLTYDQDIVQVQRVVRGGETEAGDFGGPGMAEELPFEPGPRGEDEFATGGRVVVMGVVVFVLVVEITPQFRVRVVLSLWVRCGRSRKGWRYRF